MDSYIIRIYRHAEETPGKVVGTAERVGDEGKKAFKGVDELLQILNTGQPKRAGQRRKRREDDEA